MAKTPEGKVKDMIKARLREREHPVHIFMPVPCGWGESGVDFHCAYRGRAFFIEAKAGSNKPNKRQELFMRDAQEAGVAVFVVRGESSMQDVLDFLDWVDGWLDG